MASRSEFNRTFSILTGESNHKINQTGVNLREAGLVRSGGRGLHAPDMNAEDITNIILGVMGASTASGAPSAVTAYSSLKGSSLPICGLEAENPEGWTAGEALVAILSDARLANQIDKVVVCRSYPEVVIHWMKDERQEEMVFSGEGGNRLFRIEAIIDGAIIHQLSLDLSAPERKNAVEDQIRDLIAKRHSR